jgi:hypothetical protein
MEKQGSRKNARVAQRRRASRGTQNNAQPIAGKGILSGVMPPHPDISDATIFGLRMV